MTGATSPSDALGAALGRVPSGLFIVTTRDASNEALGFLGSFVQQVAMDPPTVCVAVGKDRDHLAAMRAAGRFSISVLGDDGKGLMKPFFKSEGEGSPFDEVEVLDAETGGPVLAGALAWLDCRVSGEHDAGDHVVVFGVVESGERLVDGEPLVHTRKNGLRYA